jgi:hypothetical protein
MIFVCFRLSAERECEVVISTGAGSNTVAEVGDSVTTEAGPSIFQENNKIPEDASGNESGSLQEQSYKCRIEVDMKENDAESLKNNQSKTNNDHLMCMKVPSLTIYGPAICDLCDVTFTDMDEFDNHVACEHLRKYKWQCLRCDDSFEHSQDLVLHKAVNHGEEPISCGRCQEKKLEDGSTGDEGIEEEWLEETETRVDESRFPVNNSKDNLEFYCDLCHRNFCDETKLKDHYLVHSPQSLVCSRCGLKCSSSCQLSLHKKSHLRNVTERRYTCEVCRKTFLERIMYNIHRRRCGSKQYTCNLCDRTFWREYSLQLHMKVRFLLK